MKLEDQVCSLELAKKLKELGVKQESLYYWHLVIYPPVKGAERQSATEQWILTTSPNPKDINGYSAFTVAELGEMLPKMTQMHRDDDCWWCFGKYDTQIFQHRGFSGPTQADACANMLIFLVTEGIVKP